MLHYINKIDKVFEEFSRALKPDCSLVFSIHHPHTDFVYRPSGGYYDVEVISFDWTGFTNEPVNVPSVRRPLEGYTEALVDAGFCIERLIEPVPTERFREQLPDSYDRHLTNPLFMVIRARLR